MNRQLKRVIAYTALLAASFANPVFATAMEDMAPTQPTGMEMAGDALIGRPLMLVGTLLGTGVFLVSLPFSAIGGNADEAGKTLVVGPAKATFKRCLGCVE